MSLDLLLQQCTVQLTISGSSKGTGFFVAPGLILTCNHVIQHHQGRSVPVRWQHQPTFTQATVKHELPALDLALLHFTPDLNLEPHPCVYLDALLDQGDVFSLFGYPDRDYPNGCPVTGDCEGFTGDSPPFIKFKLAEIRPGISGSPLLNQRTGKVCGMVKFTRNRDFDLGGGAIPTSTILQALPQLANLQTQFHQQDRRWTQLLPTMSNPLHPTISIQQTSQGSCNRNIGQMSGGTAIENVEGQVYIGATIYQNNPEAFKQIVQEKYVDPAKQGLNALAALTCIPEVRRSLITYQVRFEAACQQIDTIANYKTLHDLLHTLELDCYMGILREWKRLSENSITLSTQINHNSTLQNLLGGIQQIEDSTILYNLIDHDRDLQNLLKNIEKITLTKTFSSQEVRWLTNLQEAQTELHTTIEQRAFHRLPRSINLLKRVLAIQPSRINTSLVTAARSLRLLSLVSPIQLILKELVDATLDQEKLQQFQLGVESLRALDSRLNVLITGHDNWQMFDLELRRIEDNLDQNLDELKVSWPDLLEQTKVLVSPTMDQWMITFQQDIQELDAALKSQNSFKIKQCFHLYCRQAKKSFYQVDKALKDLCQELREVGGALASVLRIIE